jgi:anti-anti-sigma factor
MTLVTEDLAGGITKVILDGRLDVEGAAAIDLDMNVIAGRKRKVLIDLQGVSFLGSMGLRSLVIPARSITVRMVVLFGPNEFVRSVLKVSCLDTMFPVYHDLEDAIAALQ